PMTAGFQNFPGGLTISNGTLKALGGSWTTSFFGNVSPRNIMVYSNATLETTTHSLGGLGAAFYAPTITLNDGATWLMDAEQYLNGSNLILKGATISIAAFELRLQGGSVTINSSSLPCLISGAGSVMLFGATTLNVANGPLANDLTVSVPVTSSGTQSLTKAGAGTMSLTKPSTYTGTTTVSSGTLSLLGGKDTLPPATSLSINAGASLALNNNDQTVAGFSGSGNVQLGYGTLSLALANSFTYGGKISGSPTGAPLPPNSGVLNPGGMTKSGAGRMTLTANQIYVGDTLIKAGTLALNGSGGMSASSNIFVTSTLDVTARTAGSMTLGEGQSLKGNGSVLGAIVVASGSTIAPGQSIGTLTTGAETWLGGGSYQWEITHATSPGSWDSLAINGSLTLGASATNQFTLRFVSPGGALPGFNNASNYTWTIATTTGGILSFDPAQFNVDTSGLGVNPGGGRFNVLLQDNNLVLTFTPYAATMPPAINSFAILPNGSFTLNGTGLANQDYVLVAATNLLSPITWSPIVTNTADTNGLFNFTDPRATNFLQQFYRVTVPSIP
ncbi:MAG: autotransporter-associated beta strand repeat-containing protein, partial [Limisphaerales bacterium]